MDFYRPLQVNCLARNGIQNIGEKSPKQTGLKESKQKSFVLILHHNNQDELSTLRLSHNIKYKLNFPIP